MDETRWQPEDWCEQARDLVEQAERGEGKGEGEGHVLARLLDLIDAGIRLRRPLDQQPPDAASEASRRAILRCLVHLRQAVGDILDHRELGAGDRLVLAGRVKDWQSESRITLRDLSTDHTLDRLGRALAVEGLRYDLEWLGVLVAWLDRDPPPSRTARLEVELERVHNGLARCPEPRPSTGRPERECLLARCERMRGVLLERRIRMELGRTTEDVTVPSSYSCCGWSSRDFRHGSRRWNEEQRRGRPRLAGWRSRGMGRRTLHPPDRDGRARRSPASGSWASTRRRRPCERTRPAHPGRDQRDDRLSRGHAAAPGREPAGAGAARI